MAKRMVEREQIKTPVHKTIERILFAFAKPQAVEKDNLGKAQGRIKEIMKRFDDEPDKSKRFVAEVEQRGQHVSTMSEWVKENKITPPSLETAKRKIDLARKLSSSHPDWLADLGGDPESPVAAEFIAEFTLLPKNLQEDPNVLFKWLARLAASETGDMEIVELLEIRKIKMRGLERLAHIRNTGTDKSFNLSDNQMRQYVTEQGMGGVVSEGWVLYDPAVDTPTGDLKEWLEDYNAKLESLDPDNSEAIRVLQNLRDKLSEGSRKKDIPHPTKPGQVSSKLLTVDKDDAKSYLERLKLKINELRGKEAIAEALRHEQQRDEEFSTMWLSPEEQKRAILDPEDVFEKWIRTIYRRRSFGQEEAAQRRITLFKEFIESESFEKKYIEAHPEIFGGLASEQKDFKLKQLQEGWSESVERSMYIKLTASAIRDGSKDFEQAVHFLRTAGTRGWEVVYLGNNGMNGVAFDILCDELNNATIMPDGKHVRLTPVLYQEVLTRTKNRLKDGVDTYKFKYGGQGEPKAYHDDDIRHFVNVAECLADIRQKVVLAVMRGRGPGEPTLGGETSTPSFQSLAYAESIAAVMDYTKYGPEKWGYLSPGAERKLEFIHEFSAIMGGYDHLVDQQIATMRQSGAYKTERDRVINDTWLKENKWRETHHYMPIELKADEEYRRILLVKYGRQRFGEILEMYDMDTSVWRAKLVLQKNHELYGDVQDHALGYWLRYVGDDFLKAEEEKSFEIFEHGLAGEKGRKKLDEAGVSISGVIVQPEWNDGLSCYQVLGKISHVLPHRSALMLYEQNESHFSQWWATGEVQASARDLTGSEGNIDYMRVHRVVSDIQQRINVLTDRQGVGVLDYSQGAAGLSVEQKKIVATVFGCSTDQLGEGRADQYFKMMAKLSGQTGKREQILSYTDPRFRQYFKRTQWVDDARLGYIEDIENIPEGIPESRARVGAKATNKDDAETRRYSTSGAVGGEGSPDPVVRAWNDLATFGMKLPMMVKEAIETTDEKTLLETLNKIKRGQDPYAGNEDAILTSVAILAGHSRYGKVDNFLIDFLGLDALPNTTESKRYQGDEGLVLELKDIERFKSKLDQLYSRLELYPHIKPIVEKWERYVGLSRFTKHKDMFWLMQAKNVAFIIAGLILLEGTKEAQSSISGGSPQHPS